MYKLGDQFFIKSSDVISKIIVIDPFTKKYTMKLTTGETDQVPFGHLDKLIEAGFIDYVGQGCDHQFTRYEGLMNRFDYCTKCDVKKEISA